VGVDPDPANAAKIKDFFRINQNVTPAG